MKMYMVGGACRDEILGIPSKDIDFSVVLDESDLHPGDPDHSFEAHDPFVVMVRKLKHQGFKIFLETPEHLTVRAQFPDYKTARVYAGDNVGGRITADFVLARKEGVYTDGRRPDSVEPGTLLDDLSRRDFRMNAMAKDTDGSLIDPFNGAADIIAGVIQAVGDPVERLREDALRALRALRFSVTKDMRIDPDLDLALRHRDVLESLHNISDERISDELSKMFRFDTVLSMIILNKYPSIMGAVFSGRVSLDSTLKQKGRGK